MTPRVALLSPYWTFWERTVPYDLREDRGELARSVAGLLSGFDVVATESFDSRESARDAGERIARLEPDVLLIVQSMATPPGYTVPALEALADVPPVVFAVHRRRRLPATYRHEDITAEGATVGTSQLANVLGRRRRRWLPVVGVLDDPGTQDALRRALRAAAATARIRRARIGLVGRVQDGYDCVECDPRELQQALGPTVVQLEPSAFRDAYRNASAERASTVARKLCESFAVDQALERDDSITRAVRCALALEDIDAAERLDAGAMNCHVEEIRFGPEPGIAPCLALGRETSRGIPWTCTGDVPTAIAMLTAKALGAATLYHELETIDYETEELAIANTGEHDLAWAAPGERPRLIENAWFASDPRRSVCASFRLRPGPATLVAFTPHGDEPSGFRFVVAEGTVTERALEGAGTPSGAFRFAGLRASEGYAAWALAGASHHSCLSPGHLGEDVARVAHLLGVGCVRVGA